MVAYESDRNRFDCILHVIMSLLVYSKPTTDDHLYNLRAKELTLGNHAVNGNLISGRCGVDDSERTSLTYTE